MGFLNLKSVANVCKRAAMVALRGVFDATAERTVANALEILEEQIRQHPISKELKAGPSKKSNFLAYGDLFSFIGFQDGRDPVEELIDFLVENIAIKDSKEVIDGIGLNIYKTYTVGIPDRSLFEKDERTKMNEWEMGNSWPYAIEEGISGFGFYQPLYNPPLGRSKGGIQLDLKTPRDAEYQPQKYISLFLSEFLKNIILNAKKGNLFTFKKIS